MVTASSATLRFGPVTLSLEREIALVSVANPPVNTINAAVRAGLRAAIHEIEGMPGAAAVVLICEGSTFFSGADISEFSGPPKEEEYRDLFRRLEQLPVPVVAGMHGTVMGGGLEIALASHYRVALAGTRFAFPEVTLGVIPGAGGTQRMPRLIGVEKTLEFILAARPIDASAAINLGFVDAEVEGDLRTAAVEFARTLLRGGQGVRRTADRSVAAESATPAIIERWTERARSEYPNREAPFMAIRAVQAAARLPFEEGLRFETQIANEAKATVESQALVHLFFAERNTRHVPALPAAVDARRVERGAVVGSGTMGGGIAVCFANAGVPVTMLDASQEALERGLRGIGKTYDSMIKRGRITAEDKRQRMGLIATTLDYRDLSGADVVIEAVFEDLPLKQRIFAEARRRREAGCRARHQYLDPGHRRNRGCDGAAAGCHWPAFLCACECHAAAGSGSNRSNRTRGHSHRAGFGQAIAQDSGSGARVLRVHRQSHDGGICARVAADAARGRDAAPSRRRARGLGDGHGHPRGIRHGGY